MTGRRERLTIEGFVPGGKALVVVTTKPRNTRTSPDNPAEAPNRARTTSLCSITSVAATGNQACHRPGSLQLSSAPTGTKRVYVLGGGDEAGGVTAIATRLRRSPLRLRGKVTTGPGSRNETRPPSASPGADLGIKGRLERSEGLLDSPGDVAAEP